MNALRTESNSASAGDRPTRCVGEGFTTKRVLGLFFLYCLLQLVFRVLASDSVELDESEQLILAQNFAWGYGNQPPLYTWLQALAFAVCGTNVFALALVKSVLIFAILAFTYLTVLEITAAGTAAFAATASLFLLPHFAWEARRDLSHTVLAMAMVVAALYFFVRMLKCRQARDYAGFGLSVGLGLLGKYNYPVFLAALVLAGLFVKNGRATLRHRNILLSLALIVGVTCMHGNWALAHGSVLEAGATKLRVANASNIVGVWAGGMGSLVESALAVAGIVGLIYLVLFRRAPAVSNPNGSVVEHRTLLRQTLMVGMILCVGMVFCLQMRFKARWLLPLLMIAPVYLTLLALPRMDPVRTKKLLWIGCAAAVIALVALPAAAPLATLTGKYTRLNAPYGDLAAELKKLGVAPGVIVAENRMVGGNLKLFFTSSTVVTPELAAATKVKGPWLVVWDATRQAGMPESLAVFAGKLRGETNLVELQPGYVEAHLKYARRKLMKLGFVTRPEIR